MLMRYVPQLIVVVKKGCPLVGRSGCVVMVVGELLLLWISHDWLIRFGFLEERKIDVVLRAVI
jgi:hypothetical protein